jgi:hypothetical protein
VKPPRQDQATAKNPLRTWICPKSPSPSLGFSVDAKQDRLTQSFIEHTRAPAGLKADRKKTGSASGLLAGSHLAPSLNLLIPFLGIGNWIADEKKEASPLDSSAKLGISRVATSTCSQSLERQGKWLRSHRRHDLDQAAERRKLVILDR